MAMGRKSSKTMVSVMIDPQLLRRLDDHRQQRAASGLTEISSRSQWICVAIMRRLAADTATDAA